MLTRSGDPAARGQRRPVVLCADTNGSSSRTMGHRTSAVPPIVIDPSSGAALRSPPRWPPRGPIAGGPTFSCGRVHESRACVTGDSVNPAPGYSAVRRLEPHTT